MYRINLWLISPLILLLTSCVTTNSNSGINLVKASETNVQLGQLYYQQGNLELANQKLLKAMRQDPKSSQAHHAYAVLQHRYLDDEKSELYFRKAIKLDPENSEALNNFGTILCKKGSYEEAEKMFLQAIDNQGYKYPYVAFTNTALCLLKQEPDQRPRAKEYLKKALAVGNNFRPALINMADISLTEKDNELTSLYLKRYHLTGAESARSLWISIQNELDMGNNNKANELAEKLELDFANSKEHKQWLALNK